MATSRRFLWLGSTAALLAGIALVLWLNEERWTPEGVRPEAPEKTESIGDEALLGLAPVSPGAPSGDIGGRAAADEPAKDGRALGQVLGAETETPERWLRGHVRLPGGEPAQKALVALMEVKSGAPVSSGKNARAVTDELGAFELAVPAWAWEQPVHLSARRRGWRPSSEVVSLNEAQIGERQELMLGKGVAIEGRVLRGGLPVPEVYVGIDVAYGTPGVHGVGREMWWADGRMEEKYAEVQTNANGRFRVAGLSPAAHRVYLHEPQSSTPRVGAQVLMVEAPDVRDYDVSSGTIAVLVIGPTGPLEGAQVVGSTALGRLEAISQKEPVQLEFPPGETVQLAVEHPRALRIERSVIVPGPGQRLDVSVGMQMVDRPRLYVTLEGLEGTGLTSISLRFSTLSGHSKAKLAAKREQGSQAFIVDEVALAPASYFVSLEPASLGSRQSFLLPVAQRLEVPAAGEIHLRLPAALGGRIETKLLSTTEKPWSGSLQLLDATGRTCMERSVYHVPYGEAYDFDLGLESELVSEEEEFAIVSEISSVRTLDASEETEGIEDADALEARRLRHQQRQEDDHGVFPPGTYTLRVTSEGHADWSQTVELTAGQTTTVDVPLGRKD